MGRRNVRQYARLPVEANVRIGWQDQSRVDKSAMTRTFDISESGMRFELRERLPLRADVTLRCEKLGLQARSTVRYCEQRGAKYTVGVEFASGYRWAPPNEEIRKALMEADLVTA